MAIIVEHDKRRKEILQKSLDIFIEEGYEDVTFQKIADRCGITRTTLYIYFKNKHEIFLGSIKELTSTIEANLLKYVNNNSISNEEALRSVMMEILDQFEQNGKLFSIVLVYLLQLRKTGVDTNERVRRRVLRLRHHMSTIIIHGIDSGEFKKMNVKEVDDILYGLLESAIYRIAILNNPDTTSLRASINLAIDCLLQ